MFWQQWERPCQLHHSPPAVQCTQYGYKEEDARVSGEADQTRDRKRGEENWWCL